MESVQSQKVFVMKFHCKQKYKYMYFYKFMSEFLIEL